VLWSFDYKICIMFSFLQVTIGSHQFSFFPLLIVSNSWKYHSFPFFIFSSYSFFSSNFTSSQMIWNGHCFACCAWWVARQPLEIQHHIFSDPSCPKVWNVHRTSHLARLSKSNVNPEAFEFIEYSTFDMFSYITWLKVLL